MNLNYFTSISKSPGPYSTAMDLGESNRIPACANGKSTRTGSVLLVTLLVVSLLLVVVLAFVVLVRLELREVANRQQMTEAQANARLGMNLAIARLQHLAGPDQRVTARADLFTDSGNNVYRETLIAREEKSKWTGVWDSTSFRETDPTNKSFLGWLVSGDAQNVNELNDITQALPEPRELVTLVGENTVARPEDGIRVPRVGAGANRHFAWWVKDENLAARFDTTDPYRNSDDPVERQYSLNSAQRYGVELMRVVGSTVLGEDLYPYRHPDFFTYLKRLVTMDQAPLIWQQVPDNREIYRELIRNRYHDLSLVSRGVLADVRNGGLRRDLNLAFEMPYDRWVESEYVNESPNAEIPLYQPPGYPLNRKIAPVVRIADFSPYGISPEGSKAPLQDPPVPYDSPENWRLRTDTSASRAPVLRGPTWDLLRNYYRLYKTDDPDMNEYGVSSGINLRSDGSLRGRSAFPAAHGFSTNRRVGGDALVWEYAEAFGPVTQDGGYTLSIPVGRTMLPGISPVVTRMQTALSFQSRRVPGSSPAMYELDMFIDPIVTLWNPYNVRLRTGSALGQPLNIAIRYLDMQPVVQATVPEGPEGQPAETREVSRWFNNLLDEYARFAGDAYTASSDITYQLELDPGNRIMEPGEVIVFSHAGPRKAYWRDRQNPDGTELLLSPGVDELLNNSGFVLENVGNHLYAGSFRFPDGHIPEGTELRFKMNGRGKYLVSGRGTGEHEPFMDSFEAGVNQMSTGWSADPIAIDRLDREGNPKQPAVFFDTYLKHARSPEPINLVAHFNTRAHTFEQGTFFGIGSSAYRQNVEDLFRGQAFTVNTLSGLIDMSGDNGFWGPDNQSAGPGDWNTRITMFDIPRAPMTSLANLQHVPVSVMADEPSFVIGNSLASIFVGYAPLGLQSLNQPSNLTGQGRFPGRGDWTMTRADWSYLLNQELFDGYYFSGIGARTGHPAPRGQVETHLQNGTPLPNSPFKVRPAEGEAHADLLDRLFDTNGLPTIHAHRELSSHLLVDGMFNINSTSVEAWTALLASTRKLTVQTLNDGNIDSPGTVYTRMSIPDERHNLEWRGFRSLSDEQIRDLAEAIVVQVRERGPFLNLADFVNRRAADEADPVPVHEHMRQGALQAAIDAAGLNDNLFNGTLADRGLSASKNELSTWVRPRMDRGSKIAQGVTGYLTQADLLSMIGPLLSARSDTFTIRSYGDVTDAQGNILARAWCEAVVQRVPDYQDSGKAAGEPASWRPHERPEANGSYDTSPSRRRFQIVRFRWLMPDEI